MVSSDERRVVRVTAYSEVITDVFTGEERPTNTLPEGSELVNTYHDPDIMSYVFVFKHPSFDVVEEGDIIPLYDTDYEPAEMLGEENDGILDVLHRIEENTASIAERNG